MSPLPRQLPAILLFLLACLSAAAIAHWVRLGQPQPVAEPGADRLQCLSYAPFRRPGENPFDPARRIREDRIEADLRILATRTSCVRTYSVQHGLDAVPRVARRLGMTVLLGAWIGRDRQANELELATAIGMARNHPDVVRGLIVGNEVMLRRELPEADLVGYIERARREVPVPVTYADVWEFWVKHPSLAPAVSFMTIHILPYWEDEPIGIDASIDHVVSIYRRMQAAFPGKALLIGETGWPSAGRARRDAVPGRVEQAQFVRRFSQVAEREGLPYNLIEAFDQPWKRRLEGAMGGYWGIFDSDGRLKFDWHGPVAERPGWRSGVTAAAAGAALLGLALTLSAIRRARRARLVRLAAPREPSRLGGITGITAVAGVALQGLTGALAGAGIGAMLAEQWHYMVLWNRGPLEWSITSAATVVAMVFALAASALLARRIAGETPAMGLAPGLIVLQRWRRDERDPDLPGWVALLLLGVLASAALVAVLHAFDARYRGFPLPLFAAPVAALVLLRLAGVGLSRRAIEERWLAAVVALGAAWMLAKEGPANPQALAYVVLAFALAGAAAWPRAITRSPSSAPAAAGS